MNPQPDYVSFKQIKYNFLEVTFHYNLEGAKVIEVIAEINEQQGKKSLKDYRLYYCTVKTNVQGETQIELNANHTDIMYTYLNANIKTGLDDTILYKKHIRRVAVFFSDHTGTVYSLDHKSFSLEVVTTKR